MPGPIGKASRREPGQAAETCVLWKAGAPFYTASRYLLQYIILLARGKGRKWVCSLKADGCGRHEVQNSAFPRGMRHRPEEPRGTPREVGNALRSEGREKIMSSVSVRAYFGESRRCGVGFSFGVDRFSMRALAFGGPAPFGNGGTGRKRCKPRRTCGYFMKHQSVYSPERWDCLAVEQPLSL